MVPSCEPSPWGLITVWLTVPCQITVQLIKLTLSLHRFHDNLYTVPYIFFPRPVDSMKIVLGNLLAYLLIGGC